MNTVDQKLDQILGLFDIVTGRFDGIDTRLDGIDTRLDGIDTRLDRIEGRLDACENRLDRGESRLDKLEAAVAAQGKHITGVELRLTTRIAEVGAMVGQMLSTVEQSLELRDRVSTCERDIADLKSKS